MSFTKRWRIDVRLVFGGGRGLPEPGPKGMMDERVEGDEMCRIYVGLNECVSVCLENPGRFFWFQ